MTSTQPAPIVDLLATLDLEELGSAVMSVQPMSTAGAADGAYNSAVLKDGFVDANSVTLSLLESGLQWKDDEVKPGEAPAKKAVSFRDKFINAIGGG